MYLMEEILRHWRRYRPQAPPIDLDSDSDNATNPQLASSFFHRLPREIRLEIYTAFWEHQIIPNTDTDTSSNNNTENHNLNPRLAQHIVCSSPSEGLKGVYFTRWPCLLSNEAFADGNNSSSNSYNNNNSLRPDPADEDGPGDVDAAYADISDQFDQARRLEWREDLPSCYHHTCMAPYLGRQHAARQLGGSSGSSGGGGGVSDDPTSTSTDGLLKLLLVCKEMYREAAPLLYRSTRFMFGNEDAARRFVGVVPKGLREFVRHVDILATVTYVRDDTPEEAQHAQQTKGLSSRLEEKKNELPNLCRFLGAGFPHLRDLCVTLHILSARDPQNQSGLELPPAGPFYEPLYALAEQPTMIITGELNVKVPLPVMQENLASYESAVAATRELERGKVRFAVVPLGWSLDAEA